MIIIPLHNEYSTYRNIQPCSHTQILNRHPPFGNQINEAVSRLPCYTLSVEQTSGLQPAQADLTVVINISNFDLLKETRLPGGSREHSVILLIGDRGNQVLCKQRIRSVEKIFI